MEERRRSKRRKGAEGTALSTEPRRRPRGRPPTGKVWDASVSEYVLPKKAWYCACCKKMIAANVHNTGRDEDEQVIIPSVECCYDECQCPTRSADNPGRKWYCRPCAGYGPKDEIGEDTMWYCHEHRQATTQ